jgi:hypothetical protein
MGAKECDRNGCDRIMCDILIDGRKYICDDCANEFRAMMGPNPRPRSALELAFSQFLESPKQARGECTVDEFLTSDGTRESMDRWAREREKRRAQ